jgi:hypothetical protein
MKALEKDQNRRYETAIALAADLQHYLSDEPVLATPPSATYRIRKFGRKHKGALSVAASLLFVILAGACVSAWQAVRATRSERRALSSEYQAKAETARAKQAEVRAQIEKGRAIESEQEARDHAARVTEMTARLYADRGRQELLRGRTQDSILPLAESLQLNSDSWATRYLIGKSKRLLRASTLLPYRGEVQDARFIRAPARLLTLTKDRWFTLWDPGTDAVEQEETPANPRRTGHFARRCGVWGASPERFVGWYRRIF